MAKSNSGSTKIKRTVPEEVVLDVFRDADILIEKELEFLKRTKSIIPTCKKGCCYCCRQPISIPIPEAHAIGQYVKRNLSKKEKNSLKARTLEWLSWIKTELPTYLKQGLDEAGALYNYGPYCPLLVKNECSVYPVRPLICRGYYVSSDPRSCRPINDPKALNKRPSVISAVPAAGRICGERIASLVEKSGLQFIESVMLLPQSLFIEMDW